MPRCYSSWQASFAPEEPAGLKRPLTTGPLIISREFSFDVATAQRSWQAVVLLVALVAWALWPSPPVAAGLLAYLLALVLVNAAVGRPSLARLAEGLSRPQCWLLAALVAAGPLAIGWRSLAGGPALSSLEAAAENAARSPGSAANAGDFALVDCLLSAAAVSDSRPGSDAGCRALDPRLAGIARGATGSRHVPTRLRSKWRRSAQTAAARTIASLADCRWRRASAHDAACSSTAASALVAIGPAVRPGGHRQ